MKVGEKRHKSERKKRTRQYKRKIYANGEKRHKGCHSVLIKKYQLITGRRKIQYSEGLRQFSVTRITIAIEGE
jgi:hypothetical protein